MFSNDSDRAAWKRLCDDLRDQIRSGQLPPEAQLPSEPRLIHQYGLSRNTIRTAIAQLRLEGLVETRPPWGTFVVAAGPPIRLQSGDRITSNAAVTVTHLDGSIETHPAGTPLVTP